MFQIRKISDLTRLCVLPVMILSIFLAFYLYVDMDKIQNKSQELVNNVIPHVLTAQQSAINLVELKSNIEMVATSPDLQRARQSYVAIRNLINNSELRKSDGSYDFEASINEILFEVNRLWKLRLQLDELRTTLHSSLHFMDTVMYLIYNEHPELFPEIDRHISNYIDLYKTSAFTRDLRTEHQFYYQMMVERLSANFDRAAFLKQHPYQGESDPYTPLTQKEGEVAANNPYHSTTSVDSDTVKSLAVLSSTVDSIEQNTEAGDAVLADLATPGSAPADAALGVASAQAPVAAPAAPELTAQGPAAPRSAVSGPAELGAAVPSPAASDPLSQLDLTEHDRQLVAQALKELMEPSKMADMKMLAIYKQELERFDPLWDLFLRMQQLFASDLQQLLGKVYELSHSFATGEANSLHAEIQYISFLASETQPMVMAVILFCLLGFSVTIFVLNRYVMRPLRAIARILTRFRQTQNIEATDYTKFTQQQHLSEIREIVDIMPQIFADYSQFKEQSTKLKTRYEELKVSSKYDDLTKVYNRGSLNMLTKSVANNTPQDFACLMIDIDYFKNLNDTMGHQHGDEVLFAVAQTLLHSVSKKDLVFRYGGEEFCIFLSEINEHNAYSVAERLCNKVKSLKLRNEGTPSQIVTVSIGLSLVTTARGQFRIEELIAQADKALYLAKRTGRDRVVSCPAKMIFADSADDEADILDEAIGEAIKEREGEDNSVDAAKSAQQEQAAAQEQEVTRATGTAADAAVTQVTPNASQSSERVVHENIASAESTNPAVATVFVRQSEPIAPSPATPAARAKSAARDKLEVADKLGAKDKAGAQDKPAASSSLSSSLSSPFSAVTTDSFETSAFGFEDNRADAVLGTTLSLPPVKSGTSKTKDKSDGAK